MIQFREYADDEIDELYSRFINGGVLYFYERTDTHQFCHEDFDGVVTWRESVQPATGFLSRTDAEKYMCDFTEGGCCHVVMAQPQSQ